MYWGTGMNLLQHLKNLQMKGYENNVVIDKRHSNNDLTIQMWRLSTKNGLETEKLTMIYSVCFLSCNDCSISSVIKANAKSQMLLVPTSVNNSHLLIIFQSHTYCGCFMCWLPVFFFFLVQYKIFCNSSQEISI